MTVKSKHFEADDLTPKATPDGTSLQELVNVFLATLAEKNIVDVQFGSSMAGHIGLVEKHFAHVLYKE
jgi:hypothetical protein